MPVVHDYGMVGTVSGASGGFEAEETGKLIQKLKGFIRLPSEHFNTWSQFCADGKRDPTTVDEARLRDFLDNCGVP